MLGLSPHPLQRYGLWDHEDADVKPPREPERAEDEAPEAAEPPAVLGSGDDGAVELAVLGPEPELLEEGAGDGEPASQLRLRKKKKKKRKWGRKQKVEAAAGTWGLGGNREGPTQAPAPLLSQPRAGGLRQGCARWEQGGDASPCV